VQVAWAYEARDFSKRQHKEVPANRTMLNFFPAKGNGSLQQDKEITDVLFLKSSAQGRKYSEKINDGTTYFPFFGGGKILTKGAPSASKSLQGVL